MRGQQTRHKGAARSPSWVWVCYAADVDVLVVDPGELGELLATLLGQYGLVAEHVKSGEAALARALDDCPVVAVVEADLADASGLDLAELLRAELGVRAVLMHAPGLPLSDVAIGQRIRALDVAFPRPFRSLDLIAAAAGLAGKPLATRVDVSGEGAGIEELAESIEIAVDDIDAADLAVVAGEPAELVLDTIVGDDADDAVTQPASPAAVTATLPSQPSQPSQSSQSSQPALTAVLADEAPRRAPATFSPGELAELWDRVKARRAQQKNGPQSQVSAVDEGAHTPRGFIDQLDAFHQSQTSGELWLEHTPDGADGSVVYKRVLLFRRGVIVGARSSVPGEDLLSRLVRVGAVDVDDAALVRTLVKSGAQKSVADAVLHLELLPQSVLAGAVSEYVRTVVIACCAWPHGRTRITLEGRGAAEAVPARVFVGDAVVHAILTSESDESLAHAAPDDARFAPDTDSAYGLEHLRLSPEEARVVIAMDGTKTIADLITLFAPLPPRLVRGLAAGLYCLHLTRFAGRGAASARKIAFF